MSRVDLIWFFIGQKYEVSKMLLAQIPLNSNSINYRTSAEARLRDIFSQIGCVLPAQVSLLYENMNSLFDELLQRVQSYNNE